MTKHRWTATHSCNSDLNANVSSYPTVNSISAYPAQVVNLTALTMSSVRLFRPLARAVQRQPAAIARPAMAAFMSTRSTKIEVPSIQQVKAKQAPKTQLMDKLSILQAGMPQLVPFFWVNEVSYAFVILPTLIYLCSKYFLPQTLRTRMARLFISKL